jgi:AcrR family transcriptional regulator
MATERTGAGDPDRTLALLWRTGHPAAPRRGPRPSRTVDDVVRAAISLADETGLESVTMRAVAGRVGVAPMSLYTYVPGRAELLDLMVDAAYLAMDRPVWRTRSWRRRLTLVAQANRALLEAHPWVADVASLTRPPLGPGLMAKYEHELSALDGTGLGDVDTDAALTFLLGFVQNHGRSAQAAARATAESRVDDAAWWEANAPLLAQALDEAAYPRAVRIGEASGAAQGSAYSPEHAWEFGLARVLDGLGALVARRSGSARPRQRRARSASPAVGGRGLP